MVEKLTYDVFYGFELFFLNDLFVDGKMTYDFFMVLLEFLCKSQIF